MGHSQSPKYVGFSFFASWVLFMVRLNSFLSILWLLVKMEYTNLVGLILSFQYLQYSSSLFRSSWSLLRLKIVELLVCWLTKLQGGPSKSWVCLRHHSERSGTICNSNLSLGVRLPLACWFSLKTYFYGGHFEFLPEWIVKMCFWSKIWIPHDRKPINCYQTKAANVLNAIDSRFSLKTSQFGGHFEFLQECIVEMCFWSKIWIPHHQKPINWYQTRGANVLIADYSCFILKTMHFGGHFEKWPLVTHKEASETIFIIIFVFSRSNGL